MMSHDGPVHEVSFSVDAQHPELLDDWLERYISERLLLSGVDHADAYALPDDDEHAHRIVRFLVQSQTHLDVLLEQNALRPAPAELERLGTSLRESRRTLILAYPSDVPPIAAQHCLNCDAELKGQYCGECGQRSGRRLISLWELLRDAFGDLFELDSRLWRTLIPLTARPGLLTVDYLRGRRARYMPPFRMYIVLSLAFFVLAFFNPSGSLSILFPAQDPAEVTVPATPTSDSNVERDEDGVSLSVSDNTGDNSLLDCTLEDYDEAQLPTWLASRVTRERLEDACGRINAAIEDNGRSLLGNLADRVPVGLLILLPVMALTLKALYPLSRRYYVEHLLFVIHYHAFAFLVLTALMLFGQLLAVARLPSAFAEIASVGISVYMPVYLFKALRRVYGQRRWATFPKWLLLMLVYAIGLAIMLLIATVFAVFST